MCDDKGLQSELGEVKKAIEQNNRALRGFDGEPGLVAQVRELQNTVCRLMTNDLPHMKDDLISEIKKLQEKSVMWPSLAKNFAGPIMVSIITALLVTLLHKLLFP